MILLDEDPVVGGQFEGHGRGLAADTGLGGLASRDEGPAVALEVPF